MSLIFIDGFDHYSSIRRKYQVASGLENPAFVAGRFGGNAIEKQSANGAGTNTRGLGTQTEIFAGIAVRFPAFPGNTESIWRITDIGGATRCSVTVTPTGIVSILAGGQVASGAVPLSTGVWAYLEIHYTAKNSGGIAELRINEVVVGTITGDTTTGAEDDIAGIQILGNQPSIGKQYLLDDMYVLNADGTSNNTYLGDVRITTMAATADANSNDWTPKDSLIGNFDEVDEVLLDSDTSYVESGLVGAAEDYDNESFASRGVVPGAIFGVQVSNSTKRTDAGTIRHKHEMVIAGIRYSDEVEYTAGSGDYFVDTYVRDTDPSDSATWTENKVANTGSGISITFKET